MRFQSNAANCGPAALRNALLCRGIVRSEAELETLVECTPAEGTSAKGILKALKAIQKEHPEVEGSVISEARSDVGLLKILANVQFGNPIIVCVDNNEHWATVIGMLGQNIFLMADPADEELVLCYKPAEFLARWKSGARKAYFGIVV